MKDRGAFTLRLLVLLCAIVLAACMAVDAMADGLTVRIVQARGGLRVRDTPSADGRTVYLLEDCETVIVLGWYDGWAQVAKNNGDRHPIGWVCGDYLK